MTDVLEHDLAAALVDLDEARDAGAGVEFLLRRVAELQQKRAAQKADADLERLRRGEQARRVKERRAADDAAKEVGRRDQIAALIGHRAEVARSIDEATNALSTLVGAYRSDTCQLETLDPTTPWRRSHARLADWLGHRLNEAAGGRGFGRSSSSDAATWRFADVDAGRSGVVPTIRRSESA